MPCEYTVTKYRQVPYCTYETVRIPRQPTPPACQAPEPVNCAAEVSCAAAEPAYDDVHVPAETCDAGLAEASVATQNVTEVPEITMRNDEVEDEQVEARHLKAEDSEDDIQGRNADDSEEKCANQRDLESESEE